MNTPQARHLEQFKRPATIIVYRARINTAMRFIQKHAAQPLHMHDIADAAHFSTFHFHRIFTAFTGETPGEYLKQVRMIRAATMLVSDSNITEVAQASGYETVSAFIQVFKKIYGITPHLFKHAPGPSEIIYPFVPVSRSAALKPASYIQQMPAMEVYFIRKSGLVDENYTCVADEGFHVLYRFLRKYNLQDQVCQRLGIIRDHGLISNENCRYDAAVTLLKPPPQEFLAQVHHHVISPGKWAVFMHQGPYDTLWQTWNWIYKYWYPKSGYILRTTAPFEVYLNHKLATPPHELLTEIYIPVR